VTKQEVLDVIRPLGREQQIQWMIDLGAELTIAARNGYPVEEQSGSTSQLVAFNEMQHQVYGRIRSLRRGDEWTLESFLDGLV